MHHQNYNNSYAGYGKGNINTMVKRPRSKNRTKDVWDEDKGEKKDDSNTEFIKDSDYDKQKNWTQNVPNDVKLSETTGSIWDDMVMMNIYTRVFADDYRPIMSGQIPNITIENISDLEGRKIVGPAVIIP